MNTEQDSYATVAASMASVPITTTTTIAESATNTSGGISVESGCIQKESSGALGKSQSPGRAGGRIGPTSDLPVKNQDNSNTTATVVHGAESACASSDTTARTTTRDAKDTSTRPASGKPKIAQGSSNDQTTVRKTDGQAKAEGTAVPTRNVQASGQASSSQGTTRSASTGGQTNSGTTSAGQMGGSSSQGNLWGPPSPPANPWGPQGGGPPANPWGPPAGGPPGVPPGGGGGGGGGGPPPPGPAAAPAAAIGQPGPALMDDEGLRGHPPEIFDGNRTKAKKFMKEFTLWKLCNLNNEALSTPFSRVALCLSYIKGPNVDDWVSATTDDVYEKVHGRAGRPATYQPDDEDLWNEFAQEFANVFADTAAAEHAYQELTELQMQGEEVDQYISTYEQLIRQAGWDRTAHGSIEYFKKGIPRKMVVTILRRDQTPISINEWQEALRKEIQRQRLISATLGARTDKIMFSRQWKPTGRKWFKDLNAMEIGTEAEEEQPEEEVRKLTIGKRPREAEELTAEKRQKYMNEGRCFFCERIGHMSQACPYKKGRSTTKAVTIKEERNSYQEEEAVKDSQQEEEEDGKHPPANTPIGVHIKTMKTMDRDYLISRLMEAKEQGF